jgi:RNA polymerase sigma-70 factor (ECF subfamily)
VDQSESLYLQFLAGNEAALAQLIDAHKTGLTLFLAGYVKDETTAEELMEDTFVRLVVKRPHFSGKSSFKTFLYAIGRNLALDALRRDKRRRTVPLEDAQQTAALQSVEEAYLKEEVSIRLHHAMNKLNDDYREALYLRYFESLSPDEIAALLHKRKKQIEDRLYHAKRALKAILEQEEAL